jgi:hypothetical protein
MAEVNWTRRARFFAEFRGESRSRGHLRSVLERETDLALRPDIALWLEEAERAYDLETEAGCRAIELLGKTYHGGH